MVYDDIKNSVPSGLSKLEIAWYLYVKCGYSFCFDTKINNTSSDVRYRLLNEIINPKLFDKIQINCYTWAQIYSSLLNEFGIANKIIKYWHSYVNFFINDVVWVADATYGFYSDLSRIQYGDSTKFFGPCYYTYGGNKVTDDDSYISLLGEVDYSKKFNALKFKELLYSINKDNIHSSISCDDDVTVSKLKFIFSKVGSLSFGYYESKEFIFELERILLSRSDLDKIISIELVRNNSINNIDILQCICVNTCKGFIYFILCPNLPVYQIYPEDFSSLLYLGFKPKKVIPGIDDSIICPSSNFKDLCKYDFIQAKTKRLDYVNP